jgi:hypothetical protein
MKSAGIEVSPWLMENNRISTAERMLHLQKQGRKMTKAGKVNKPKKPI